MIKSFHCKDTEKLFNRRSSKKWSRTLQKSSRVKLVMLDAAVNINDLTVPPGNRLEKLKGDRAGQHSIRINKQWRICFKWRNGDAYDVEINKHYD